MIVFISYRRADSDDIVGRIYDRLAEKFGREAIFKDVDAIPLGTDFRQVIDTAVGNCQVLLAVIGRDWLTVNNGSRRLDNPRDYVRLEIESALERRIPVIPLLVRGAKMPSAAELPLAIRDLAHRHGISVRSDPDFKGDMERLIRAIEPLIPNKENSSLTEWKIVLDGELNDLSPDKQEQIINNLKEIGKDSSLKLKRINQGSISLILEGSEEGFRIIQALHREGRLTEVCGLSILRVEVNQSVLQNSKLPIMHILHLSDLHFGTLEQARLWSNQLVQDLRNELNIPHIDALILSGDIANKSTQSEYEAARQFLNDFCTDFPLEPKQIIIVPGNHDLNWEKSKKAYTPVRREDYDGRTTTVNGGKQPDPNYAIDKEGDYVEQQDEELIRKRFTYFSEFYQLIKGTPYPIDYTQQYTIDHFPARNILILGLNSAWQLDHHYKERASINMNALTNALTEIRRNRDYNNCLKIAVWHHPLDSAGNDRITDQGFMEQLAVAGFRFFLHGHVHQAETSFYRYDMSGNRRKLDRICAGTFGAPTRELVPGYPWQYNLLKFEANLLTVETRRREQENGAWKPDARWGQGAGQDPLPRYTIAIPEYTLEAVKKK